MENPEDEHKWEKEAEGIVKDIKNHVHQVVIATELPNSLSGIYLNIETLERSKFCIKLAGNGFQVVGHSFNQTDIEDEKWFETPQSLLSSISPGYIKSFGNELSEILSKLVPPN